MHIHVVLILVLLSLIFSRVDTCAETAMRPYRYKLKDAVEMTVPLFTTVASSQEAYKEYLSLNSKMILLTFEHETNQKATFQFFLLPVEGFQVKLCQNFDVTIFTDKNGVQMVNVVGSTLEGVVLFNIYLKASFITIVPDEEPEEPKEKPKPPPVPREQDDFELGLA